MNNRSWGLLGVLLIVAVLSLGNLIVTKQANDSIDHLTEEPDGPVTVLQETAEGAEKAASQASADLNAAIAESNNSDAVKAFQAMIASVKRIEYQLCGGPCPEPPKEE